ncbi:MAG: AAA family ATPase [Bacteroidales bacterium]|nr:AAA family ATPase [Bacteroidales bacterium]
MCSWNPKARRIPYGIQGFEMLRRDNCYYVDKTRFVREIEYSNKYFFLVRPRRFGKTLTMTMLEAYYDIHKKDKFEQLFSGLWIGDHPTESRNSYLVLEFNFSLVNGTIEDYKRSFDAHCKSCVMGFCWKYEDLLPAHAKDILENTSDAVELMKKLREVILMTDKKVYIFIDEYDNFTNNILSDYTQLGRYMDETHRTGYLRTFFNAIKDGSKDAFERLYITGVSPVTLDDLTSGFNIGTNYTAAANFNEITGFTESEARDMIDYYSQYFDFPCSTDQIIETIRPWYDNYCFAEDCFGETTMFNSDMLLYFIDKLCNYRKFPKNIIDSNIRTDYAKLKMLIHKDKEMEFEGSIIQTLVTDGQIVGKLVENFPAENIVIRENFISLLYYFGMVTIGGFVGDKVIFKIPNIVVQEQLMNYLMDNYEANDLVFNTYQGDEMISNMAFHGQWKEFFDFVAESVKTFASTRDKAKGESFVHGFTLASTCKCSAYFPHSEADTYEGFPDLYLEPRTDLYRDLKHSYLIEFKYVKADASQSEIKNKEAEAVLQLEKYSKSGFVVKKSKGTTLHCLVVMYKGFEMTVCREVLAVGM